MSDAIVIVGGGPAGGAAAIRLASAGRAVTLVEREAGPRHKVCGEFLSIEAQATLAGLGVDLDALGASRIDRLRLVHGSRFAETGLPFVARGLTRRAMDEAVLAGAVAAGVRVERGTAVRAVDGTRLTLDGGGSLAATTLLLANGKHDIRGARRATVGTTTDLIGFKTYWRLTPAQSTALAGHIELVLFDGGYAGLQQVEAGAANLCLLVSAARLARCGGRWEELLPALLATVPHLARRLDGAEPLLDRALAIAGLPYGFLHRGSSHEPPRCYRAGDQLAVIPSFAGDGMAIALTTGLAAAAAIGAGEPAPAFHARTAAVLGGQLRLADTVHRLSRRTALQPPALILARLFPGLLRAVARATRVPDRLWAPDVRAGLIR